MRIPSSILIVALAFVRIGAQPARDAGPAVADVQRQFVDPPADSRIMMRWWWFGPSVTREELDAEMRHMKEGGIGGFEVATVYPLAIDDPARGLVNEPYLSARVPRQDRVHVTARARARPPHGSHARQRLVVRRSVHHAALAATRLRSERREIAAGVTSIARPASFEHDRLVAAFIGRGSAQEVDPSTFRELAVPTAARCAFPTASVLASCSSISRVRPGRW